MSLTSIVLSMLLVPPEAVEEFQRGRELYANADYEEALAAFERADSLHPAADLQYNIALCHMRLENWSLAIAGFEVYLRTKENPTDRADVEARIAEARRRLALRDAASRVQQPAPVAPPTIAEPPPTRPLPADTEPTAVPAPWVGLTAAGGVLLGVGVAGTAGGTAGLALARARKDEAIEEIVDGGNPRGVSYAEAQRLQQDAERLRMYQWVTVGVGSGVAATGAILLGVGLKRRRDARRTSIAVRPLASGSVRGLSIRGRF
jgi:tetratricopeptide (TPR) repeat protein